MGKLKTTNKRKGRSKLKESAVPEQKLSKPNYRAARKFPVNCPNHRKIEEPKMQMSLIKSNDHPIPNVTDFLTFLCYRRTHRLPAKLNFNKLFEATGVQQQHKQCSLNMSEKTKPGLWRSLVNVNNNNKGDNFCMKVVLRRLFLNEEYFECGKVGVKCKKKDQVVVKKDKSRKKTETKSNKTTKALKNVQNVKKLPSKRASKKPNTVINTQKRETPERMNTRYRFFRIPPSPLPVTRQMTRETKERQSHSRKTDKKNHKVSQVTNKHRLRPRKDKAKPIRN